MAIYKTMFIILIEYSGKYWGGERGAGSAKDLEAGIELGSLWAQLRYMSKH